MIEEELKEIIEKKFGNVKAFSIAINLPYTTVRSILQRGILNSNVENVLVMSEGLGFKPEDLIKLKRKNIMIADEKQTLIDKTSDLMEKLSINDNKKIYRFSLDTYNDSLSKVVPLYGSTAANPTELSYGDTIHDETVEVNVPDKADCALVVKGDSMEPEYYDGEIVFYKSQPTVENGEIAIVEINGDGVSLKKVYFNYEDDKIVLRSLNDNYDDRELSPEEVRILGKAVK